MNPDTLIEQIRISYQSAADILGITFLTATPDEQSLIKEMSTVKLHHQEWYASIGPWAGFTGRQL